MTAFVSIPSAPSASAFTPGVAMILAAGLGLRMRPLTLERPKPLLSVGGRTLLDHALDRVQAAGVGTAVVNCHYKAEMIRDHLTLRAAPRIILSPEAELLETGGGVRKALPVLGPAPFYVINADILWRDGPTPALRRLAQVWNAAAMDALLLLAAPYNAIGYDGPGDFLMENERRLVRRPSGGTAPYIFAGVQIVRPELYQATPEGPFSNNLVWDRAAAAGRLFGLLHDQLWFHVGTPQALDESDQRWQDAPARFVPDSQ